MTYVHSQSNSILLILFKMTQKHSYKSDDSFYYMNVLSYGIGDKLATNLTPITVLVLSSSISSGTVLITSGSVIAVPYWSLS